MHIFAKKKCWIISLFSRTPLLYVTTHTHTPACVCVTTHTSVSQQTRSRWSSVRSCLCEWVADKRLQAAAYSLQPSAFLPLRFSSALRGHHKIAVFIFVYEYVIFKCFLRLPLVRVQARAAISSPFYATGWCLSFLSAFLYKTKQFNSIQYNTIL